MFILFFYRTLFILKKIIKFYKARGFPIILQTLGINRRFILGALRLAANMEDKYVILNELSEERIIAAIDEVYET